MANLQNLHALSKLCDKYKASLVAVSKTKPFEEILQVYATGQLIFGENKVQELAEKYEVLPKDIQWHLIGHLQRNKVKYVAPFVHLIHAVDSVKLAEEINKEAAKNNRIIPILLQIYIADEETKFGFEYENLVKALSANELQSLSNISISGVMGMATFTEDESQIRKEFQTLKNHFNDLKANYFSTSETFKEISMGMSGDYQIALDEGSTMIRVGSAIFNHIET
jgi:pyridoxal phosphate enzyme (YggS family)